MPSQITAIEDMTDASWKMLQASQEEYVAALLREYEDFQSRVVADILRIHIEASTGGIPSYDSFIQAQGHIRTVEVLRRELERLNHSTNALLDSSLIQQYKDAYNHSAWALDETTPPNIDINYAMPSEQAIRQFVAEPWNGAIFSQRIGAINNFMAQDIQQAVTQAMLSGDSVPDLAKRISGVIGDADSDYMYRAKMIARTELSRASNLAHVSLYEQNDDLIEDWYWVTRSLASPRLCDDCRERAGLSYSEVEELADEQDLEVDPPAHVNCFCMWMARPKKFKDIMPPEITARMSPEQLAKLDEPWYMPPGSKMDYSEWSSKYLQGNER